MQENISQAETRRIPAPDKTVGKKRYGSHRPVSDESGIRQVLSPARRIDAGVLRNNLPAKNLLKVGGMTIKIVVHKQGDVIPGKLIGQRIAIRNEDQAGKEEKYGSPGYAHNRDGREKYLSRRPESNW